MGMSHDEFKTAFLRDQAKRKKQQEKEYMDYASIATYRIKKHRNTFVKNEIRDIVYNAVNY